MLFYQSLAHSWLKMKKTEFEDPVNEIRRNSLSRKSSRRSVDFGCVWPSTGIKNAQKGNFSPGLRPGPQLHGEVKNGGAASREFYSLHAFKNTYPKTILIHDFWAKNEPRTGRTLWTNQPEARRRSVSALKNIKRSQKKVWRNRQIVLSVDPKTFW